MLLVQKEYDSWRYQNARDEARRLQRSGNSRRMKKEADSQDLLSFESCRSSAGGSSRRDESGVSGKDAQVVMSETAGKAKRGRGEDAWRLEPEGETEMPETRVVSDGVDGVHVDSTGEGRHERKQETTPEGKAKRPEKKVKKLRAQNGKQFGVEPEETQDYVREANDMDQEEGEEISFVPSATSFPQKLLFRCDTQCSEKTLSFWQLASVEIKEGEESCTTNLCQKCYNGSLKAKGDEPLTKWQWHEFVEKKAHRGRLWKMMGKEQYVREMWEYFRRERDRGNRFRVEAEEGRQAGMQGQWQLESPARDFLEQVKCCDDTDCTHRMMKQGYVALKKWRVGRIKKTLSELK